MRYDDMQVYIQQREQFLQIAHNVREQAIARQPDSQAYYRIKSQLEYEVEQYSNACHRTARVIDVGFSAYLWNILRGRLGFKRGTAVHNDV